MITPTVDQINSFLRHVYSATATAISVLVMVGLSQGDATAIGEAVHQIGDGIAKIVAGISILVPIASGLYAAWSASPFSRLMQAKKNPQIEQVIVKPNTPAATLAESIPGSKIVVAS